ncbi:MAG: (d)CMP kinase [Deltaproteobacteria bacterium]|nr:(d)CMP kinase [Deltaproteobacteria bacterium]
MKLIITIDGPAGSGKSTVSRILAKRFGYLYLDTGAMYRAVALQAAREGRSLADRRALRRLCMGLDLQFRSENGENRLFLSGEDISEAIRSPEMDRLSSTLSAYKEVRKIMTKIQRRLGSEGGVVAEGRDMGTIVFPEAEFKFFLTADLEVRAQRRYLERTIRGESVCLENVKKDLIERDQQDTNRVLSPLRPAEDAVTIDSTYLNADEVVDIMLKMIREG